MPKRRQTTKQKFIEVLWTIAQLGGLAFFAWINASHFDKTELAMLGEFAIYYKLLNTLKNYTV